MLRLLSKAPTDTEKIGEKIGQALENGDVVCLSGELGVGKTAFVKGLAKGMGVKEHITSPTFTIVNEYNGKYTLYHFDVYRVNDVDELCEMGFEEYLYGDGISVIEWAELIKPILPKEKLWVEISKDIKKGEDYREISLTPYGEKYSKMVQQLTLIWSDDFESSSY